MHFWIQSPKLSQQTQNLLFVHQTWCWATYSRFLSRLYQADVCIRHTQTSQFLASGFSCCVTRFNYCANSHIQALGWRSFWSTRNLPLLFTKTSTPRLAGIVFLQIEPLCEIERKCICIPLLPRPIHTMPSWKWTKHNQTHDFYRSNMIPTFLPWQLCPQNSTLCQVCWRFLALAQFLFGETNFRNVTSILGAWPKTKRHNQVLY